MKSIVKILLGLLTIILLSNFIPNVKIGEAFNFQTQNKEFEYRCVPTKGSGVLEMEKAFTLFKNENPQHKDLVLYRSFKKQWWKCWKWREYVSSDVYNHPYLEF